MTHLELRSAGHHLLKRDADALDDGEQDSTADGAVTRALIPATDGETAACEEARDDRIVRVLLFPDALDCAVEGAKEAAPDAKVAAEDRRAHLDGAYGACSPLAERAVAEAFDAMPDSATNGLLGRVSLICLSWEERTAE